MVKYILILTLFGNTGQGPNSIPDTVKMTSYSIYNSAADCQGQAERIVLYYGRHVQDVQCMPFTKQVLRRNY